MNSHDLEVYLACYASDVLVTTGHGEVLLEGIDAVREQYGEWFTQLAGLHAEVHHRIERGDRVVDDEHATGRVSMSRRWWPTTSWTTGSTAWS